MTSPSAADLASVELLAGLSDADRGILAGWLETEQHAAGHRLTHEGDFGYAFHIISAGSAQVTVAGDTVAQMEAGDYYGEISILGDGRMTATVTSLTPITVWVMSGSRFRELQRDHPDIAQHLAEAAAERRARHA